MNITQWTTPSGQLLRQLASTEGDPLFVAKDVCEALGIDRGNMSRAMARLDDDEKGVVQLTTPGGTQECSIVTEPGLYKLIARSTKPEAKAFDRWVRHEVLPTIRKTGGYHSDAPPGWLAMFTSTMATILTAVTTRLDGIEAKLQGGTPVIIPAEEMSKFKRTLNDVCRQTVTAGLFGTFRKARYNFETRIRRAAGWPRSAGATLERMPSSAWHYAHVELSEILNEVKRFGSAQLKLILDDETDPKAH